MGCATGVVKNLVFLFNFLCAIVGLVLIVLGSLVYVNINKIDAAINQNSTFVPVFILSMGVLIFIISFLGCCGVCQRSQCMLSTYATILILFFVIQLALGIYGYVQVSGNDTNPRKEMSDNLEHALQNKYNNNTYVKDFFNEFQKEFKCCGAIGPKDYEKVTPGKYPSSCCGLKEGELCSSSSLYPDGCSNKIYDYFVHYMSIISYVALGICATEIVAALFAICLVNSYKNDERRGL